MAGLTYVGREVDPATAQMGLDLVFETKDGFISAGAVSDAEWAGMCRAFGRPELIEDERFRTAAARSEHIVERRATMSAEIAKWRSAEILARLTAEDVPCAPILRRQDMLANPQIVENAIIETHEAPGLGQVRQPRPAARFDKSPAAVRSPAPRLGEHGREILSELGLPATDIDDMIGNGIVTAP